jgi:hypothetical protein
LQPKTAQKPHFYQEKHMDFGLRIEDRGLKDFLPIGHFPRLKFRPQRPLRIRRRATAVDVPSVTVREFRL